MRKIICICLVAMLVFSALTGCAFVGDNAVVTTTAAPTGKIVVNFEGIVKEINGDEITLESGKVIVISDDTVFAGDPDTGNAVSDEIVVGNYVQGYTADDPEGEKVTAAKVYTNSAVRSGGKIVVNFEGRIAAVENDCITLEDGTCVLITDDTVFSVPAGVVASIVLTEGVYIQGNTADDPASAEITAVRIHVTTL